MLMQLADADLDGKISLEVAYCSILFLKDLGVHAAYTSAVQLPRAAARASGTAEMRTYVDAVPALQLCLGMLQ